MLSDLCSDILSPENDILLTDLPHNINDCLPSVTEKAPASFPSAIIANPKRAREKLPFLTVDNVASSNPSLLINQNVPTASKQKKAKEKNKEIDKNNNSENENIRLGDIICAPRSCTKNPVNYTGTIKNNSKASNGIATKPLQKKINKK